MALDASYIMQTELSEIGAALAQARKRRGQSQSELAAALRMSRATLSGIENGTIREIGVRKLIALCAALGYGMTLVAKSKRPTLQDLRNEQRAARA